MTPLSIFSYPRAILHIDGDCFFVSCEVAKDPSLKGKVVITGMERGIVSSLSYEAKAIGVKRGMRMFEVKKLCPQAILIPSDYETYSLYSLRMYNIVRRYTSEVEEYSIDECFADLTGMRRPLHMSYEKIAEKIKNELDKELGMTFSVGLAPTKVLAKVASKWKKPSGLTNIPGRDIHLFLKELTVDKIWGIGPQTSAYLNKCGVRTALEFATKSKEWVQTRLSKPYYEIWSELNGNFINSLNTERKESYQSISKTKTFTPPSTDFDFVFSQLSKNIENACIKARRYNLVSKKIFFFLKQQDFQYQGMEIKLTRATNIAADIVNAVRGQFKNIFEEKKQYRSTGIVLVDLEEKGSSQLDLFSDPIRSEKMLHLFGSVDELSSRYGKHSVFLGSSFEAMTRSAHIGDRQIQVARREDLFKGENKRKRLALPMLGEVV